MANDDYDTGYKKPPRATQFKKGQSGNPKGRPKGSKNKKEFVPLTETVHEFQKMIVDAGYEEINIVKDGHRISVNKLEALLMQLYNKAMNGNLGAAKILLEYTQKSLVDLDMAATRVRETTKAMRDKERDKVFTPHPKPDTYGAFLKNKHIHYSRNFGLREIFGPEQFPPITEEEPLHERDWREFNEKLHEEYIAYGDDPFKQSKFNIHSLYEL